ncbi:Bifunctional lysine-specific demethylase and histidyl-hydroxylase NO66 [Diplonema papillatum]|nr:Bifunctional lysine-specific demethylase and histidyl-hydroxylase NO66 [Diplonema papillatum]
MGVQGDSTMLVAFVLPCVVLAAEGRLPPAASRAAVWVLYEDDRALQKVTASWELEPMLYSNAGATWTDMMSPADVFQLIEKGESTAAAEEPLQLGIDFEAVQCEHGRPVDAAPTPASATRAIDWGRRVRVNRTSIVLHGVDQRWPRVRGKSRALAEAFGCSASATAVVTPPGGQALPRHVNKFDAFVLQLRGAKRWSFFSSTDEAFLPRADQSRARSPGPGLYAYVDVPPALNASASASNSTKPLLASAGPVTTARPTRILTTNPGDILYIPRGTQHTADTLSSDHTSLHVSFYIECPSDHLLWEELLHLIITTRSSRDAVVYEQAADQYIPAVAGWEVRWSAVCHMVARVASNIVTDFRRSVVGLTTDGDAILSHLMTVILPLVATLRDMLDADAAISVDVSDVKLAAWVMSGVETRSTVTVHSPKVAVLLSSVADHVGDLLRTGDEGLRSLRHTSDRFWRLWYDIFDVDDPTTYKIVAAALQQLQATVAPKLQAKQAAANTRLERHNFLRKDPGLF